MRLNRARKCSWIVTAHDPHMVSGLYPGWMSAYGLLAAQGRAATWAAGPGRSRQGGQAAALVSGQSSGRGSCRNTGNARATGAAWGWSQLVDGPN
jgi:hypothetical protein